MLFFGLLSSHLAFILVFSLSLIGYGSMACDGSFQTDTNMLISQETEKVWILPSTTDEYHALPQKEAQIRSDKGKSCLWPQRLTRVQKHCPPGTEGRNLYLSHFTYAIISRPPPVFV